MSRVYETGPGFARARECPDCGHTRCGESCVCNCDAAHAEAALAAERAAHEKTRAKVERLREALIWCANRAEEGRAPGVAQKIWEKIDALADTAPTPRDVKYYLY